MARAQYQHYIPIADYHSLEHEQELGLDDTFLQSLAAFQEQKAELERELQQLGLEQDFRERLLNYQAIETGQIEGLYKLNRGITETLIEKGFKAELISHNDAEGQDANLIAQQLQDQKQAMDGLFAFVKNKDSFSLAHIRQLHEKLCAHQQYTEGIDNLRNKGQTKLIVGAWKQLPNNPSQLDGQLFHYCPPEQVEPEMQALCEQVSSYLNEPIASQAEPNQNAEFAANALLGAAWLHHRFSLIHPFQDGNGRTARLLASLCLIRGYLYPFMVTRDCREQYLDSLKAADERELKPLRDFMLQMQRQVLDIGQAVIKPHRWKLKAKQAASHLQRQQHLVASWDCHPELQQWASEYLKPLIEETIAYTTHATVILGHVDFKRIEQSYEPQTNRSFRSLAYFFKVYFGNGMADKQAILLFKPQVQDDQPVYAIFLVTELEIWRKDTFGYSLPDTEKSSTAGGMGPFTLEQLQAGAADEALRDSVLQVLTS